MDRGDFRGKWLKVGIFTMKGMKRLEFWNCHCEEGTQVTDAAIHRVSGDVDGLSVWIVRTSGSPPASPSRWQVWCGCVMFVIARRTVWTTRQSIVSRRMWTGNYGLLLSPLSLFTLLSSLFHILDHSGSPRALDLAVAKGKLAKIKEKINDGYFFPYLLWDSSTRSPSTYWWMSPEMNAW